MAWAQHASCLKPHPSSPPALLNSPTTHSNAPSPLLSLPLLPSPHTDRDPADLPPIMLLLTRQDAQQRALPCVVIDGDVYIHGPYTGQTCRVVRLCLHYVTQERETCACRKAACVRQPLLSETLLLSAAHTI